MLSSIRERVQYLVWNGIYKDDWFLGVYDEFVNVSHWVNDSLYFKFILLLNNLARTLIDQH